MRGLPAEPEPAEGDGAAGGLPVVGEEMVHVDGGHGRRVVAGIAGDGEGAGGDVHGLAEELLRLGVAFADVGVAGDRVQAPVSVEPGGVRGVRRGRLQRQGDDQAERRVPHLRRPAGGATGVLYWVTSPARRLIRPPETTAGPTMLPC